MRESPLSKPLHPALLLGRLDGLRSIYPANPRDSLRGKNAGKNSHAREHCSGAATPAQAADFDQVTPACSVERVHDLLRCDLRVLGQAEVGPSNDICWPCRFPARIGVEAEGALGIVDTTVGDRRCAYPRPVREDDDLHVGSLCIRGRGTRAVAPVTERLAGFGISGRVPRVDAELAELDDRGARTMRSRAESAARRPSGSSGIE
jgi:hypothetical protein